MAAAIGGALFCSVMLRFELAPLTNLAFVMCPNVSE